MRVRLSLRTKLALAFMLVLLPILGLVIYDSQGDYQREEKSVLGGQESVAHGVAASVDAVLDQGIAVGQALVVDPVILSFDPIRLDPYLARYPSIYPQYESVNIWDAAGQNVGASVPQPAFSPRPSIADRPHFQKAMATGLPVVSDVLVARITGRTSVAVAIPIKGPAGRPIGCATILINLSSLTRSLKDSSLVSDQVVFVTDASGGMAIDTRLPNPRVEEQNIATYEPVRNAQQYGRFSGTVPKSLENGPRLVTTVRSPRYGWITGVSTTMESAFGAIQRQSLLNLTYYLAVVAIGGLISLGITYAIIHPLNNLTRTIGAFGNGDMGRRAQLATGDELERLAVAFNDMADRLQKEQNRTRFISEAGATLSSAFDADKMASLLAERARVLLGDICWVNIVDDCEQEDFRAVHTSSRDPLIGERVASLMDGHRDWLLHDLCPRLAGKRKLLLLTDLPSSSLETELRDQLKEAGVVSGIVAPLIARGHAVGLMACFSTEEGRRFDGEDATLAMDLARRAATSADNALLYRKVQLEQKWLETILDTMPVGVLVAERPNGVITKANRAAVAMSDNLHAVGVALEDHSKGHYVLQPSGAPFSGEEIPLSKTLSDGIVRVGEEILLQQDSGKLLHLLVNSAPLRDEQGEVVGAVSAFEDITAIREMERAREDFISVIAHDLRSPLTVIIGFAALLQKLLPPEQRQTSRALNGILSSARRLERMVDDLLDASRIEAHRLVLVQDRVDLATLLPDIVDRASALMGGHTVRVQLQRDSLEAVADAGRLEQVIHNLLSNAAKYSFKGTEVLVELEVSGTDAIISVTNSGEGVAKEEINTIFTRYGRAKSAQSGRVSGLGLGLYISRGLVEAHHGRLWVESEPGGFTTFRLSLPLPIPVEEGT